MDENVLGNAELMMIEAVLLGNVAGGVTTSVENDGMINCPFCHIECRSVDPNVCGL